MMYDFVRRAFIFLVITVLAGCAFGQRASYEGSSPFSLSYKLQTPTIVAVHDKRPYVVSGNHSESYVGWMRSLAGIPYGVHTQSGNPLAKDFGLMITTRLKELGFNATQEVLALTADDTEVRSKLIFNTSTRSLYFELQEWETDRYFTESLEYNIRLIVFDEQANELARSTVANKVSLGDFESSSKPTLAKAVAKVLEELLQSPNIKRALSGEI